MSVRVRNVRPKPGYVFDGRDVVPARSNVIPFRDGALANIMTGRGTSVDRQAHNFWHFLRQSPEQIEAAYRSNWLARKIVDIPAQDMTRAGRDWDAPDEDIAAIEKEEKRLGYWAKLRQALILGRLGGGAILIGLGDDPSRPLPATLRPGQVQYLTVLSRWQLMLGQMVADPISPLFGQPEHFQLSAASSQVRIHPSRVVCFHGIPVPSILGVTSWEDHFWGDPVLQAVDEAVQHATMATGGFASLIDEAKVDVFTMPGMYETLSQPGGEEKFLAALQATATGKSVHRMLALGEGETWETRTISWTGMPDVIRTYLSIVAGAADIPATRLLGKSPDGLNSTGDADLANYFQMVGSRQEMDLRPAMEMLDAVVLPSAGVTAPDLSWAFSPLMVLTEEQQANIENKEADTVTKYANAGTIPERALAKAVQNRLIESQRWPGLAEAIEEAEAAGEELPEDDPSEIVPVGREPAPTARDARFNDATPRTLYVSRRLLNADELIRWAKGQGFRTTQPAEAMHVTIAFSRHLVDWMEIGTDWSGDEKGHLLIRAGGPRVVEPMGDKGAVALLFRDDSLEWRHQRIRDAGASWDHPSYQPHVTITWDAGDIDLSKVEPYSGPLRFGPEIFAEVVDDWEKSIREVGDKPSRPFVDARLYNRWPAGTSKGGQFRGNGSGGPLKTVHGPVVNSGAIRSQTGVDVSGLVRVSRATDIVHARKLESRDGAARLAPSKRVLANYHQHAAKAVSFKAQGSPGGSGIRIRSEIKISGRSHTLIERVGRKKGELAFVTMWRNG